MEGVAYIDGTYVPIAEARIPILDWGFLRSDATYDVVHVWRGSFFRLSDHVERFLRGVGRLHLRLPVEREELEEILAECVRRTGLRDAYVEMICTRGLPAPGSRDQRRGLPEGICSAHAWTVARRVIERFADAAPAQAGPRSSTRACIWRRSPRSTGC